MSFKLDKNNTGFKPIEAGEYEVYPIKVSKTTSQNGNKMVTFNYIIRDDIDQPFKGQELRFDNFVETAGAMWRVNLASVNANMDMDKEYADIYEWADDFLYKAIRVRTGIREFNGNKYPQINDFMPSRYGGTYTPPEELANNPFAEEGKPVDIQDDDLPF